MKTFGSRGICRTLRRSLFRYLPMLTIFYSLSPVPGIALPAEPARCILIEVYYRSGEKGHAEFLKTVEEFKSARGGIMLAVRDVDADPRNQERLDAILKHFRILPTKDPVIYGLNRVIHEVTPGNSWTPHLEQLLQLEVFVRTGCSRCASAKQWLPTFVKEYPGLKLVYRDVAVDAASASRLSTLVEKHKTAAASVPVFSVCDSLVVGFYEASATGDRLRNTLKRWTRECPQADKSGETSKEKAAGTESSSATRPSGSVRDSVAGMLVTNNLVAAFLVPDELVSADPARSSDEDRKADSLEPPTEELSLPLPGDELPIGEDGELPLPGIDSDSDSGDGSQPEDQMEVPFLGRLRVSELGMPVFTLAVGLVDGFNPCAMWVLLFLLSILVNLRDRKRILAIAGTFVVVSGLAYFAFMAAWLNVFMLIGYLRSIQVGLAVMAIVIGSIHVKDFFAFKKGFSLSIPESAKPGIYARVRSIVTAEHLTGAVAGAITLAVLVNIIELLCTAGLPALYTIILMQQGYSAPVRYGYLSLYIVAYMADDSLMVLIVVWTLSKKKLQEAQGRWLKLVSGAAILLLGVIMLFRPDLLH